jgi:hypothetical protein
MWIAVHEGHIYALDEGLYLKELAEGVCLTLTKSRSR